MREKDVVHAMLLFIIALTLFIHVFFGGHR
jgi:hypothetical protein